MKPLIAIPRWRAPTWERTGYYMDSLEMAGARCQLIETNKLPKDIAGFLLMGGVDVNPKLYGEKRSPFTDRPHDERDTHELKLLDIALKRDIPVLAICRGHQLLNVAMGGSLVQHIEDDAHRWLDNGDSAWHDISVDADSKLAKAYENGSRIHVNSRHHQGITQERLAPGLRTTAASHEKYVEGYESESHGWVVGVQWHPERPELRRESAPLFSAFVKACAANEGEN